MGVPEKQTAAAFMEKLSLLKPEDRARVHDRIDSLLAERPRPPQKPAPPRDGGTYRKE